MLISDAHRIVAPLRPRASAAADALRRQAGRDSRTLIRACAASPTDPVSVTGTYSRAVFWASSICPPPSPAPIVTVRTSPASMWSTSSGIVQRSAVVGRGSGAARPVGRSRRGTRRRRCDSAATSDSRSQSQARTPRDESFCRVVASRRASLPQHSCGTDELRSYLPPQVPWQCDRILHRDSVMGMRCLD